MKLFKKIEELRMRVEAYFILKKIENDPTLKDLQPPQGMHEKILAEIHRRELENQKKLSEEQKELISLGVRYKRQRKNRRYLLLAAMLIMLFAMGMTSLGGAEKVFYRISSVFMNRGREVVDSGGVENLGEASEEEIYAQIEELFGIYPVKMTFRPERTVFQEASIYDDTFVAKLIFTKDDEVKIIYWMYTSYRDSSIAKDYEDTLLDEYTLKKKDILFDVKEYDVENRENRWLVQYEYKNIVYSLYIMDTDKLEVEKIIEELHFS